MSSYQISYIISTKNRLPFLRITLGKLIENLVDGEEIIVVDAASTDGTTAYLAELLEQDKIHQLLSEPDKNQAEGWNKAMLLANGLIIKKIIDDDVFDYHSIRKCAEFMLQHEEIDVVISNDLSVNLSNTTNFHTNTREYYYQNWANGKQPSFTFGDVHMLIRRKSLAYFGLYNAAYVMLDWEYSLRISYLKANIAYYTGYNALSVGHEASVSANKNMAKVNAQTQRACIFYEYAGDYTELSRWSKIKIGIGKKIHKTKVNPKASSFALVNISVHYNNFYDFIANKNNTEHFKFLTCQNL